MTDTELGAWRGMLRVSVPLRRRLGDALKQGHDLTLAEYGVLSRLAEQPDRRLRMSELADAILQPRSSLTRIADGLERRALIVREPSVEDARGAEAVLTKAGYAAFRRAQLTYHQGIRERFLARLSDEQIAQLGEAWAAIGESGRPPRPPADRAGATADPVTREATPRPTEP